MDLIVLPSALWVAIFGAYVEKMQLRCLRSFFIDVFHCARACV